MSADPFFDVYSEQFFLNHTQEPHFSQTKLVGRAIAGLFGPATVVDVGCGVGAMLLGISEWGKEKPGTQVRCVGIESPSGIERMRRAGAMRIPEEWYFALDLREPPTAAAISAIMDAGVGTKFDVAISAEVAEHLPSEASKSHVELLCALSDTVVLSAAYPGQGGDQHINERPWTYWRGLFGVRNFGYDEGRTRDLIDLFRDEATQPWGYAKNMRVYRRGR
jgi:hypothetical protein